MSPHYRRHLPLYAGGAMVLLVVAVVVYLVINFMQDAPPKSKKVVEKITLIKPPPPPPPREKPPPPKQKQKVEVKQPKKAPPKPSPKQADKLPPPIDDNLGLDAMGGAGGDAFGLVGKQGGRDLIGGGGGSRFRWYAGVVENDISEALSRHEDIRKGRYTVVVKIWVGRDGNIKRIELVKTTGKNDLDKRIRLALDGIHRLSETPPEDLPQPIAVRISSSR
ncbi:MAG TPA: TonB C-terminal domain-containing protein [Gammaproteobacteria bacterium]|nr:TonB C-terminal domain-containing protein [Gammaproteobacteria bacterium]